MKKNNILVMLICLCASTMLDLKACEQVKATDINNPEVPGLFTMTRIGFAEPIRMKLFEASRTGNAELIMALIAQEIVSENFINMPNQVGETALFSAVESGNLDVISLLIKHGANVNAKNADYETPLHRAYKYGNLAVISLLVKHGAELNAWDQWGETLLHKAVYYGQLANISFLVEMGADVNANNDSIGTPLHRAVARGNLVVISLLLKLGADINANKNFEWGNSPLHSAVDRGNLEVVSLLLQHGADVNAKNNIDRTPLIKAIGQADRDGNLDIILILLKFGADVNIEFSQLLKFGADVNNELSQRSCDRILHFAVERCFIKLATLLLGLGADVNARDSLEKTPLHSIQLYSHADKAEMAKMVILLISFGADVNAKDLSFNIPITHISLNRQYFSKEDYDLIINPEKNVFQILNIVALYLEPFNKDSNRKVLKKLVKNKVIASFLDRKMKNFLDIVIIATLKNDRMILAEFTMCKLPLTVWNIIEKQFLSTTIRGHISLEEVFAMRALVNGQTKAVSYNPMQSMSNDFKKRIMQLLAAYKERCISFNAGRWAPGDFCSSNLPSNELNQPSQLSTPRPASQHHKPMSQQSYEGVERLTNERTDVFRSGLAIDADGMQIIAAASAIRKLEEEAGCRSYELFDCIAGSNWGGILALALAASEDGMRPFLKPQKIIDFFKEHAEELFPASKKKNNARYYDIEPIQKKMRLLFGSTQLSGCLTRVVVPYRENTGLITVEKKVFDSREAQKNELHDFDLADIAYAIIADDVNFAPVNWRANGRVFSLTACDFTLNADMLLYRQNKDRFENHLNHNPDDNLVILSITSILYREEQSQIDSRKDLKKLLTEGKSIYERVIVNVQEPFESDMAILKAYEKEGNKFTLFPLDDSEKRDVIVKAKDSKDTSLPRHKQLIDALKKCRAKKV